MNLTGQIETHREAGGDEALASASDVLASNSALGIFPEGTRSKRTEKPFLLPGKTGIARLAASFPHAKVIPVALVGTREMMAPQKDKLPKLWKSVNVNFGSSITWLEWLEDPKGGDMNSKKLEIPVCCDEKFSKDIKRLEEILKLSREKILEKFLNKEYFCYMTGFIAGMPFLGDLDKNMRVQRLETPRVKVPKGSVAITEQFTNIYTFESPGGWNILGNTPLSVFDSSKEDKPNLINPGDTVIFKEITIDQYKNFNE